MLAGIAIMRAKRKGMGFKNSFGFKRERGYLQFKIKNAGGGLQSIYAKSERFRTTLRGKRIRKSLPAKLRT